jgi:tetratricopeptide (TPR) repeat protein
MMMISRQSTNHSVRRSLANCLLVLLLGLVPTTARADDGESFKTRYDRAVTLYTSGQYDRAIEEFRAVYEIKQAPILLFNIAQAQRKAKQYKNAIDMYQRFIDSNPKEELKTEAAKFLEEAKAGAAEEEKAAKEAADKAAADKAAADKAAADKAAADKATADYKRRFGPTRPLNIAKWVAGGAGIVLTIVGAALVAVDGSPACDLAPGQVLCQYQLDTVAAGGTLLGVGLAAIAGSAVMFGIDYKQTHDAAPRATASLAIQF